MKLLLLLLLVLCLDLTIVCVHAEGKSSLSGKKFNPEQYTIGLACDKREKIEEQGSMRVFVEYIHVFKNSSLAFKFHTIISEVCSISSTDHGYNVLNLLATDSDDFVVKNFINIKTGRRVTLECYGRKPELSSNIKENSGDLCEKHGIVKENILDLTERCVAARE
uniref:Lipocalin/cytosolic fatty-acid binding domain-containing protein n=1 Tax=Cricetulus griseus TaxID=10029 RepID=A0A8C2LB49_CRIGR